MRFLLFLLLAIAPLRAQSDLDRIANEELARQHLPGLALVGVKDGHIVYAKGFGVASAETTTPMTPDTLFRVGSTTKMVVAAAVLKLAGEHRLRLDVPVSQYIEGINPRVGRLTAHQLLSHTSGLMDETKMYGSHDDEALARNVSSWRNDVFFTAPGRVYSYSNLGFVLAGRLIEAVRGQAFAAAMEDLMFRPLEMKSTTFRPTMAMTFPLAQGHSVAGVVVRPAADHAGYWPAGSMFTSGNDFAKFVIAFLNGQLPADLAKPVVEVPGLTTGVHYGYGLQIDETRGVRIIEHNGSRLGYTSAVMMAPEFKMGVVVLCNKDGGQPNTIAQKALESMLPVRFSPAPAPVGSASSNPAKYAGKYRNGPNTLDFTLDEGKLTLKSSSGVRALDPITETCFRGGPTTVCFTGGYAHSGGRAYAKAGSGK